MFLRIAFASAAAAAGMFALSADIRGADEGISVNKDKKEVVVDAEIAPRKLPDLNQIYPIEVFASDSKKNGAQKAHETVIIIGAKPSAVHKAIESLGLKAGKATLKGQGKATGPELKLYLEWEADGKAKRIPAEEAIIDTRNNKPLPGIKWIFTGSAMVNLDPEKDDLSYGADSTKTVVGVFPVTNQTVIQTNLEEEGGARLESNFAILPKIGTKVKLIITPAK